MKRLGLLVLAVGVLTGCPSSPVAQCNEAAELLCKRIFECATDEQEDSPAFVALFGSTQSECDSKAKASECALITDSNPCTDSSKKWSSTKAASCISDIKAASCETFQLGTFSSGNCDNTCG